MSHDCTGVAKGWNKGAKGLRATHRAAVAPTVVWCLFRTHLRGVTADHDTTNAREWKPLHALRLFAAMQARVCVRWTCRLHGACCVILRHPPCPDTPRVLNAGAALFQLC